MAGDATTGVLIECDNFGSGVASSARGSKSSSFKSSRVKESSLSTTMFPKSGTEEDSTAADSRQISSLLLFDEADIFFSGVCETLLSFDEIVTCWLSSPPAELTFLFCDKITDSTVQMSVS